MTGSYNGAKSSIRYYLRVHLSDQTRIKQSQYYEFVLNILSHSKDPISFIRKEDSKTYPPTCCCEERGGASMIMEMSKNQYYSGEIIYVDVTIDNTLCKRDHTDVIVKLVSFEKLGREDVL